MCAHESARARAREREREGGGVAWAAMNLGPTRTPLPQLVKDEGAFALCAASLGLHADAVAKFLAAPGVDPARAMEFDVGRTPLHCLGMVWCFGDSLRESYIFSLLTNQAHWLDEVHPAFHDTKT